jgi:hypothetical protein
VRRFRSQQFRVGAGWSAITRRTAPRCGDETFLNQDCVFDLGLESLLLRTPLKILFQQHRSPTTEAVEANMSVHFRFAPKATVAD